MTSAPLQTSHQAEALRLAACFSLLRASKFTATQSPWINKVAGGRGQDGAGNLLGGALAPPSGPRGASVGLSRAAGALAPSLGSSSIQIALPAGSPSSQDRRAGGGPSCGRQGGARRASERAIERAARSGRITHSANCPSLSWGDGPERGADSSSGRQVAPGLRGARPGRG